MKHPPSSTKSNKETLYSFGGGRDLIEFSPCQRERVTLFVQNL